MGFKHQDSDQDEIDRSGTGPHDFRTIQIEGPRVLCVLPGNGVFHDNDWRKFRRRHPRGGNTARSAYFCRRAFVLSVCVTINGKFLIALASLWLSPGCAEMCTRTCAHMHALAHTHSLWFKAGTNHQCAGFYICLHIHFRTGVQPYCELEA